MRAEIVTKLKTLLENIEDPSAIRSEVEALGQQFQQETKKLTSEAETATEEAAPAAEPVAEVAPQAEAAPVAEPVAEAAPEAEAAPAAEPVAEAAPEAEAAPAAEPVAEAAPEAEAAPAAEPVAEAAPEAEAAPVAAPVAEAAPEAEAAPAPEPAAEVAPEAEAAPVAEPVAEVAPQAEAAPAAEPVAEAAPEAEAAPAAEPVAEAAPEAEAAPAVEPVAEVAPEAEAAPAAEPVAEAAPEAEAAPAVEPVAEVAPEAEAVPAAEPVAEADAPEAAAETTEEAPTPVDPIAEEFKALMAQFRAAVNKQRAEHKAILEANLEAKRTILTELEALVKDEENLGRLFQNFRDLQDRWKAVGEIPSKMHADLQRAYSKLVEDFYYNVRIYKELKEHDLKRNFDLKKAVIERMKTVGAESSVRKAEEQARKLLEQWDEIGPTHQEKWEELREEFREAANVVFGRVREHYHGLREQQKANLDTKMALCDKVEAIVANLPTSHKKWMERSTEVIALQKEWKSIGFASKKANEKVWERFRGACNTFFDAKSAHYNAQRSEQNTYKAKKEALIEQALGLKDNTDWKTTSDKLIKLQKEWQTIGPAHQRDEQRLWRQFREACDAFFNAKKKNFEGRDEAQNEALKAKEAILAEIAEAKPEGRDGIFEAIKDFRQRWNALGHVPFKAKDRISKAFGAAIDAMYDKLDVDRAEREAMKFQARVDNLSDSQDAEYALRKEKAFIREKIDKIKATIIQYENNLGFFAMAKGKEADRMKAEVEEKIAANQREVDGHKEKLKQLDLAMRKAREAEAQQEAEVSGEES